MSGPTDRRKRDKEPAAKASSAYAPRATYNLRLCRDASGWFVRLQGDPVPEELVWVSLSFADRGVAVAVLHVARAFARSLSKAEEEARLTRAISRPPLFG